MGHFGTPQFIYRDVLSYYKTDRTRENRAGGDLHCPVPQTVRYARTKGDTFGT